MNGLRLVLWLIFFSPLRTMLDYKAQHYYMEKMGFGGWTEIDRLAKKDRGYEQERKTSQRKSDWLANGEMEIQAGRWRWAQ